MPITPVDLTDTFDVWRIRTNQNINLSESANTAAAAAFTRANAANVLAFNTGIGANAYATAATAGANAYMITIQNGSNTAIGTGANSYLLATLAGANVAVGTGANAYMIAVQNGSNTAVGTGANAFTSATIAGANTAVGVGANAFTSATIAGANTAIGTGANAFATAAATGANTVAVAAFAKANSSSVNIFSDLVNTNRYVTFANNNSGNTQSLNVSTYGLLFNPFTSTLTSNNISIPVSLGIGTAPSGTAGEIRATSDITAYYSSDISLKENINVIPDALSKLIQINGVEFDWSQSYIDKRGGEDGYFIRKRDVGVIAQEVEKILPQVVATRGDGIKAVKYEKLIALLIEAIKELNEKIESKKE
jgi:hypothetical protein